MNYVGNGAVVCVCVCLFGRGFAVVCQHSMLLDFEFSGCLPNRVG